MPTLTDKQIAQYAFDAGFRGGPLIVSIAVALSESRGLTTARHVNTDGSVDRGLWQINSRWHPEVSNACAYNPSCAATQAHRIAAGGASWSQWATFTSGAYKAFNSRATAAAKTVDKQLAPGGGPSVGTRIGTSLPGLPGWLTAPAKAADILAGLAGTIINPHFWLRVLYIVGGLVAMILGALVLARGELSPLKGIR